MNPYARVLFLFPLGIGVGVALALAISALPWPGVRYAIAFGFVGAIVIWTLREMRWLKRMQRELEADAEKFAAVLEEAQKR